MKYLKQATFYNGYIDRYAFAPEKGVIVVDKGGAGIVSTCSALVYYSSVKDSIAKLKAMTVSEIASAVNTSATYAEMLRVRLVKKLTQQLELAGLSEEVVLGIVRNGDGSIAAVGKRTIMGDSKKESKEIMLRRLLPVGTRAVYPLTKNAMIHEARTAAAKSGRDYILSSISASSLVTTQRPVVFVILDTNYYRQYCGRSFLTRETVWDEEDQSGIVGDAKVILLRSDGEIVAKRRSELTQMKSTELYTDWGTPKGGGFSLANDELRELLGKEIYDNKSTGLHIVLYLTAGVGGYSQFGQFMKWSVVESTIDVKWTVLRAGLDARQTLRTLYWKSVGGIPTSIRTKSFHFAYDNTEGVRGMFTRAANGFGNNDAGISVNTNRIKAFYVGVATGEGISVKDAAKDLGIPESNVFVSAQKGINPPYLFGRGSTVVLANSGNMPINTFAGRPPKGHRIAYRGYVYAFTGDPDLLLAKHTVL